MGLTVSFVLAPETGLCCLRLCREALASWQVDISVGISGPHDFSGRVGIARLAVPPRPSHPASNVRDDRETPLLSGAGRAGF